MFLDQLRQILEEFGECLCDQFDSEYCEIQSGSDLEFRKRLEGLLFLKYLLGVRYRWGLWGGMINL